MRIDDNKKQAIVPPAQQHDEKQAAQPEEQGNAGPLPQAEQIQDLFAAKVGGPSASEQAFGDAQGATAFTQGNEIHVADQGNEKPAHEATHTVQQRGN